MTHLTEETIDEYLDHALTPAARADADAHLAVCADCLSELETLRELFTVLDSLPSVPLERDLTSAVLTQLRTRTHAPRPLRWVLALQMLAVVVSVAVIWPLLDLSEMTLPVASPDWSLLLTQFRAGWGLWLSTFSIPTFTAQSFSLHLEPSTRLLTLTLVSACLLWLVGNGLLLLVPRRTSLRRRHS